MDTGAIVAVTIQGADQGDTTTISETLREASDQLDKMMASTEAGPHVYADGLTEVVADKGYHSDQTLMEIEALGLRPYVSEPERGPRKWKGDGAQEAVYANRRRIRGVRGRRLQRRRGERAERPFAHL